MDWEGVGWGGGGGGFFFCFDLQGGGNRSDQVRILLLGEGCKLRLSYSMALSNDGREWCQSSNSGKDSQGQMQTGHIQRNNFPCKLNAVHELDSLDDPFCDLFVDHNEPLVDGAGHGFFIRVVAALDVREEGLTDRCDCVFGFFLTVRHYWKGMAVNDKQGWAVRKRKVFL